MSCGVSFMKFTLIFFNAIFLLIGLAGTGVGIWVAVDHNSLFDLVNYSTADSVGLIQTSAYIFIAGSAFVVLVSILGILGACTQNKCLLGVYAFLVILIFAIELAALITVVVYDAKFRNELEGILTKELKQSYSDINKPFTKSIDVLQKEFQCCGITNYTDFDSINITTERKIEGYPKSCHPSDTSLAKDRYPQGCYMKFRDLISKYAGAIIGIVVAILIFELILFIFAVCLTRHDDFGNKMV